MAKQDVTAKVNSLIASGWTLAEINTMIASTGRTVDGDPSGWSIGSRSAQAAVMNLDPKGTPQPISDAEVPMCTERQAEYLHSLTGIDLAEAYQMTRHEASRAIDIAAHGERWVARREAEAARLRRSAKRVTR